MSTLHASDLYLACACALGDAAAIAAFDRHVVTAVAAQAAPGASDEVAQLVRERVLVAGEGSRPKIAGYTGRGPLAGWLRVTAARVAIDLGKRAARAREQPLGPELAAEAADPELQHLQSRYGQVVREAIAAVLAALSPREAAVLRLFFLEGLTMERIGGLYRASQRTAKRWVAAARQKILDETHRRLTDQFAASSTPLESIIRLVRADIEPSIVKLLRKPTGS